MKGKRVDLTMNDCPIARALGVIGDWWSLLIIRDAFQGKTRFGEFQKSLGLAKNILAVRLKKLTADGIFRWEQGESPYGSYVLTDKGRSLAVVLVALWQWGEQACFEDEAAATPCVDVETHRTFAPLELRLDNGKKVRTRDVGFLGAQARDLTPPRATRAFQPPEG